MCIWIPGKERLFPHLLTHLLAGTHFFCFFLWGLALLHSFSACSLLSQVQPEASQALLSRLPRFGTGLVQPLLNGASYHQLSWWVLVGEFTRDGLVKRHCGWAALDVWPGLGGQMREARLSLAKVGWQRSSSAGRNQGKKTAFTEPGRCCGPGGMQSLPKLKLLKWDRSHQASRPSLFP